MLNDRERRIFQARRLAETPIGLEQLAGEFGVSRERIRQIENQSLKKLQTLPEAQQLHDDVEIALVVPLAPRARAEERQREQPPAQLGPERGAESVERAPLHGAQCGHLVQRYHRRALRA